MADDTDTAGEVPRWEASGREFRWKGKEKGKGKWRSKSKRKGGKGNVQGWVISEETFAAFFGTGTEEGDRGSRATGSRDAPPRFDRVKDEVKQETPPGAPDGLEPDDAQGWDETMDEDTAREDAAVITSDMSGCIPPPMGDPRRSDFVLHVRQWLRDTFTDAELETILT